MANQDSSGAPAQHTCLLPAISSQLTFLTLSAWEEGSDESQSCKATQGPSWGYSKVNSLKIYQLLAINTREMAPRTNQWLQERTWDTPTKGLLWSN